MKGEITKKIIEIISEVAGNAGDVMKAFLTAGYGASRGRIEYERSKYARRREGGTYRREEERQRKQRYRLMISYLKRDGLIRECKKKGVKVFEVTIKGKKQFARLQKRAEQQLPALDYEGIKSSHFTIVIFDIPEKERGKRRWLREALGRMGITKIQKVFGWGKLRYQKISSTIFIDFK
jgi:transposase